MGKKKKVICRPKAGKLLFSSKIMNVRKRKVKLIGLYICLYHDLSDALFYIICMFFRAKNVTLAIMKESKAYSGRYFKFTGKDKCNL